MFKSMRVRRLLNDSGRAVLTFHVGSVDDNLAATLQWLADLVGEVVHQCSGPYSIAAYVPKTQGGLEIPAGHYRLLFGAETAGGAMVWRQHSGRIFVEGFEDDDDDGDDGSFSPADSPSPTSAVGIPQ